MWHYYFLLEPVRSGKRWEEKSSTPSRGKINHFAEFWYSLISQACWSSLTREQTVVRDHRRLIYGSNMNAVHSCWWSPMGRRGCVMLPEWLVLATANFDASLCCRIWMIAIFVLHSVEVTQEEEEKRKENGT